MWNETEGGMGEKPKIVIEIDDKENEGDNKRRRRRSENEPPKKDRGIEQRKARTEHRERKVVKETPKGLFCSSVLGSIIYIYTLTM